MTSDAGAVPRGPATDKVQVVVQGDLPYRAHRWARHAVDRAVRHPPWPLVRARVRLTRPPHLVATCRVDIETDLGGHLFHARAEARDPRWALDIAAERLHRQVADAHASRAETRAQGRRRPAGR